MAELLNNAEERVFRDYDLLRDDCGLLELPGLALASLTGDDRKGWLQGQVTNDLRRFESGYSTSFCLCEPTGHLRAIVDGWALDDRFLFTFAQANLEAVRDRVETMVVLEDVALHDLSKEYRLLSIQGPTATQRLAQLIPLPKLDAGTAVLDEAPLFLLRSNRTGLGGWDVVLAKNRRKAYETLKKHFEPIGEEAYEIARLEAGIPQWGSDVDLKTFPPELGPAFDSRHVSYTKGCYMGQEVLMRIHSRGHTNRTWMALTADQSLEAGAVVMVGPKEVGKVTSAVLSPDYGPIGGAMLRNEVAYPGESVRVMTSQGPVEAEVRAMPLLRTE